MDVINVVLRPKSRPIHELNILVKWILFSKIRINSLWPFVVGSPPGNIFIRMHYVIRASADNYNMF